MAVKPIANKQVVDASKINRAEQVSTKDINLRGGNKSRSYIPGRDFTKNYSVTLKDIDSAVLGYVKNIISPKVQEANETVDVNVMYGNEERWKSVRKRGTMRDKNGSIILPLIMLRRTSIEKNTLSGQGFEHDVTGENIQVVRSSNWSKDNRYDRFSVLTGVHPKYESMVTGMPDFTNISYEFILWTNYIEQMNSLVETFVAQSAKYWGTATDYKFLSTIDSIADATEMDVSGERFVKSTFTVITQSYLLPEYINSVVTNKVANMKRQVTTSKVNFSEGSSNATDQQVEPQ